MISKDLLNSAEQRVRAAISAVRDRLDTLETNLANGRTLNDLGELQQLGPQLDAAVARLSALREIRDEYNRGVVDAISHIDRGVTNDWIGQQLSQSMRQNTPFSAGYRAALEEEVHSRDMVAQVRILHPRDTRV